MQRLQASSVWRVKQGEDHLQMRGAYLVDLLTAPVFRRYAFIDFLAGIYVLLLAEYC